MADIDKVMMLIPDKIIREISLCVKFIISQDDDAPTLVYNIVNSMVGFVSTMYREVHVGGSWPKW
jgi:hypothetical protein